MTDPYAVIDEVQKIIDKAKRIVLTTPADLERVQAAVDTMAAPGLVEVRSSPFVPTGQVIVLNPNMISNMLGAS